MTTPASLQVLSFLVGLALTIYFGSAALAPCGHSVARGHHLAGCDLHSPPRLAGRLPALGIALVGSCIRLNALFRIRNKNLGR